MPEDPSAVGLDPPIAVFAAAGKGFSERDNGGPEDESSVSSVSSSHGSEVSRTRKKRKPKKRSSSGKKKSRTEPVTSIPSAAPASVSPYAQELDLDRLVPAALRAISTNNAMSFASPSAAQNVLSLPLQAMQTALHQQQINLALAGISGLAYPNLLQPAAAGLYALQATLFQPQAILGANRMVTQALALQAGLRAAELHSGLGVTNDPLASLCLPGNGFPGPSVPQPPDAGVMPPTAPAKEPTGRPPTLLYLECDADSLSPYQCLVRNQIELFEALREDVESNAQGRNRPIVIGQVGIRCRYCNQLPPKQRARGGVYYPARLNGLYQAAQNMAVSHLAELCEYVPARVRDELKTLRERKSSAGGGKKYWAEGVRVLGVYEADDGLRFERK